MAGWRDSFHPLLFSAPAAAGGHVISSVLFGVVNGSYDLLGVRFTIHVATFLTMTGLRDVTQIEPCNEKRGERNANHPT